ncbi:MAG: RecQ family ATP-dependent DNA helicase [bacterium]
MQDRELQSALKRHFGFDTFRLGQEAVIRAVMEGRDCLAVMPTGGGKSLCFQLPALLRPGLTLVISPLIALMKDQVDGLVSSGIAATFINSSLPARERAIRLRGLADRRYQLVYVAPERFRSPRFLEALSTAQVTLFAVDEAHCVSMWGHDFRPDYLQLAQALTRLGNPQVLCLTATATPEVRADIAEQLALGVPPREEPELVVRGFARPGLTLAVTKVGGREDKLRRTRELLGEHTTGIVYCATRKSVEWVTERLARQGVACVGYHAGMDDEVRERTQEQFVSREVDVVVATNAFGMGIDRADVRTIIHWELPGSVEAYYQEAGRAGRDGLPARCELLFNYADVRTQEFFIENADPPEHVDAAAHAVKLERDRSRLRRLLHFANHRSCRHATILRYFGDPSATGSCGNRCDNCLRQAAAERGPTPEPSQEQWVQIQKVLSCAARLRGRFGRNRVVQVLAGSRDQTVIRMGLDQVPSYGSLSELTLARIRTLVDALEEADCLQSVGDEYPTVQLTEHGRLVMQRQASVRIVWPEPPPPSPEPRPRTRTKAAKKGQRGPEAGLRPLDPVAARVAEELRHWRRELAQARGQPAFHVLTNSTLEEIARLQPADDAALLAVKGIGPAKLADLGRPILALVRGIVSGAE